MLQRQPEQFDYFMLQLLQNFQLCDFWYRCNTFYFTPKIYCVCSNLKITDIQYSLNEKHSFRQVCKFLAIHKFHVNDAMNRNTIDPSLHKIYLTLTPSNIFTVCQLQLQLIIGVKKEEDEKFGEGKNY